MKTRTIISLGPATDNYDTIKGMIEAGMNIARINFSHANEEEARMRVDMVRKAMAETGKKVILFQDLCGPRIRIGTVEGGREIAEGEEVTFYTLDAPEPQATEILINDPYMHTDLSVGNIMLFDSGKFRTEVTAIDVDRQRITVRFLNGGTLLSKKGINVPGVKLTTASPTEKDKQDIVLGKELGFEWVAVSFAQTAEEINNVRALLNPDQQVWAKVEEPVGVSNLDEIIAASDGIVVARGDLGVEVPMEEVPFIQKMMVKKCNEAGKPVMVATQMLASMVENPRPTRAEVSDVANAVLDGADIIWVSEETTLGKYPVEVVKAMVTIAARAEEHLTTGK